MWLSDHSSTPLKAIFLAPTILDLTLLLARFSNLDLFPLFLIVRARASPYFYKGSSPKKKKINSPEGCPPIPLGMGGQPSGLSLGWIEPLGEIRPLTSMIMPMIIRAMDPQEGPGPRVRALGPSRGGPIPPRGDWTPVGSIAMRMHGMKQIIVFGTSGWLGLWNQSKIQEKRRKMINWRNFNINVDI